MPSRITNPPQKVCHCGKTFVKKGRVRYKAWNTRKYCSRKCIINTWNKGKKASEETRRKNSEGHKGQVAWNKGLKLSPLKQEIKNKISVALKGRKPTPETLAKIKIKVLGQKRPSIAKENHHMWKGGEETYKARRCFTELRRRARKLGNGGSHTSEQWQETKVKYNFTCLGCLRKEPEIKLTQDHIVPLSKGGRDDIENIQPLCGSCNGKKKAKTIKYEYQNA